MDIDTRRVKSPEELCVDLALHLPPFVCVSVMFAATDSLKQSSIGPHMGDTFELSLSMQLAELVGKNPEIGSTILGDCVPLSLCLKEPHLFTLSPDHHVVAPDSFTTAHNTLTYHERRGHKVWPVSMRIEPLPKPFLEDTLTCRSLWTQQLGRAWFSAEQLISRFCPLAAMNGLFSRLLNYCLWLYGWSECMDTPALDDNDDPGDAILEIASEWRAWSMLHHLDIGQSKYSNFVPKWSAKQISKAATILGSPFMDSLHSSFNKGRISTEQEAVLATLPAIYNIAYNPLAIAGSSIAKATLGMAISGPNAKWCSATTFQSNEDCFESVETCGAVMIKSSAGDPPLTQFCDKDDCFLRSQTDLQQIWNRQNEIETCIGTERCFGQQQSNDHMAVCDLWRLAKTYLHIVDRYFCVDALNYLSSIPQGISVQMLISDDDSRGKVRINRLKTALSRCSYPFLEIRVVTCTSASSAHPLHDRYIFSADWGASLSSSLLAIGSNALWAFKLEDVNRLHQRYFEYFWSMPFGTNCTHGVRSFVVNPL